MRFKNVLFALIVVTTFVNCGQGTCRGPRPMPRPMPRRRPQPCRTTDNLVGVCRPPAYCFYQYDNPVEYQKNMCEYVRGLKGVCCPSTAYREHVYSAREYRIPVQTAIQLLNISWRPDSSSGQNRR